MKSITIADGSVVTIHYKLTLEDGQVVDASDGREPLAYLHGHGNIVPGLEQQLLGRATGDELEAVVQPADGYGEFDPEGEQEVPRDAFPKDVQLRPGMMFHTEDETGDVQPLWIKTVAEELVTVTSNHPMAGRTLHFQVRVVGVRQGTSEELEHGHPHGQGGHHH